MRRLIAFLVVALGLAALSASAHAAVSVRVDLASQTMVVTSPEGVHRWAISSGKAGYRTPNGRYRPQVLKVYHYSRKYHGAMPYSVFFRGGYAIHGTSAVRMLGRPASHGCIRLATPNARHLFGLVKRYGSGRTSIAIHGATPQPAYAGKKADRKKVAKAERKRDIKAKTKTGVKTKAGKTTISLVPAPHRDGGAGPRSGGHPLDGSSFPQRMLR